jgi:hypothetical protein
VQRRRLDGRCGDGWVRDLLEGSEEDGSRWAWMYFRFSVGSELWKVESADVGAESNGQEMKETWLAEGLFFYTVIKVK